MSFALEVKEEILNHEFSDEQIQYLLCGFIKNNGELIYTNTGLKLKLSSNSNYIIRNIYTQSKKFFEGDIVVSIIQNQKLNKAKTFQLTLSGKINEFLTRLNVYDFEINDKIVEVRQEAVTQSKLMRAYISGLFIATGSVNSPTTSNYHLEVQFKDQESADYLALIAKKYNFIFKVIVRKSKYVCYIKKSLDVEEFLQFMSADQSAFKFANVRIKRDVSNNVNRMMNIDLYNQQKTLNTGTKQAIMIEQIKQAGLFDQLSHKAKTLAELRMEMPDASYVELEDLMQDKGISITKSGVSNLFKIIKNLAEEIRG